MTRRRASFVSRSIRSRAIEMLESRVLLNAPGSNYTLQFDDEFNGTSVDYSKWQDYTPWGSRAYGGQYLDYMVNANTTISGVNLTSNVSVSGGALHLTTQKTASFTVGSTSYNYTSGWLTTGYSHEWSSGYLEIRAKLPTGAGNWPAFWMTNGWPPEDDIMEAWPATSTNHQGLYDMSSTWHNIYPTYPSANTWHTWGLDWGPGYQTFYLDGQPTLTINTGSEVTSGSNQSGNPPSTAQYILFDNGIQTGQTTNYSNSNNNSLDVDYVRVYGYTASAGPAVPNAGFNTTGNWNFTNSSAFIVTGGAIGRSGTGDLHIEGAGEAYQTITGLAPNTTYTLTGYAIIGSGTTQGLIGVRNYGGNEITNPIGSTDWTQGAITFTTGASNTSAFVFLRNTNTNKVYFDDVSLTQAPLLGSLSTKNIAANSMVNVPLTVTNGTGAGFRTLSASSSNQVLVTDASLSFNGNTLTVTPQTNQSGSATITVTVADSLGGTSSQSFLLNVISAFPVNGDAGGVATPDVIRLARNGSLIDVFINNVTTTPDAEFDPSQHPSVNVNGLASDDTLYIDYGGGDPVPSGGIVFDGGAGSNSLNIIGLNGGVSVGLENGNSVTIGSDTITYANTAAVNIDPGGKTNLLNGNSATSSAAISVTIDAGAIVTLSPASTLPSNTILNVNGFINFTSQSESIDQLNGSGSVNLGSGILTLGSANGGSSFSGSISGSGGLSKSGAGSLTLSGSSFFTGGVSVGAGALNIANANALGTGVLSVLGTTQAAFAANLPGAAKLSGLTIASGASLDLANDDLAIDYSANSPLSNVIAWLKSGYQNGAWNGTEIRSSAAASSAISGPLMAPAAMEASSVFSSFPATFANQSIDSTAVLIHFALAGDAGLGGSVNALDFNALATNFGATGKSWMSGDFNYDGVVNVSDFTILAQNFGASAPSTALPAPSAPPAGSLFSDSSIDSSSLIDVIGGMP